MTTPFEKTLLFALLPLLASACVDPRDTTEFADGVDLQGRAPWVAAESQGLLEFLNHPATTVWVLDNEVRIDRRAASALIARRNGPDGLYPTADDQPFGALVELDEVDFVGPSTMERLLDHIRGEGWRPGAHDVYTVIEGVPFSSAESRAVLHLANTAEVGALDAEVGLDRRAAAAIAAARPLASLDALAECGHVGPAALERLKAFSQELDCDVDAACPVGFSCLGVAAIDRTPVGRCREVEPMTGEGDACEASGVCGDGLACVGLTRGEGGVCMPSWMRTSRTARPAASIAPEVRSEVVVNGVGDQIEDVIVHMDLTHADYSDLRIVLTAPDGGESVVWDRGEDHTFAGWFVIKGVEGEANGRWGLRVEDHDGDHAGVLHRWTVEVGTRW